MSFSSWTITGYGVRISDIKNAVSLVNLMKLIQTAPDLYAKVRKFIDEECNGQIMETYDILTTYVENYGVSNYGGIADILSEVINEVEHIEFSVAEDADDNLYLILPPTYPWEHRELSEQEKNLTEEETAKILSKCIRVITTDVLDIKFWSISNFS